jgi:hypothetical protein
MMLGSKAEQVLRLPPAPVLIVNAPRRQWLGLWQVFAQRQRLLLL